ncbi:Potentiating neddylation domain [Trinorchestia longiramus]|nr:Potentiating neddylation domain [Trinorchestia longiramus]
MGKCLSCLRDDQGLKHHEQQLEPFPATEGRNLAVAYHQCRGLSERSTTKDQQASTHIVSEHSSIVCTTSLPSAATADRCTPLLAARLSADACSNGTKHSNIMGVTGGTSGSATNSNSSEKKSFYARIPPLTRPTSHEHRRPSSKEYYSETKINTLFDVYREPPQLDTVSADEDAEDVILTEGIQRFCADLDVSADDFRVLLFAWKCEAETMCRFTRSEFVRGCKALRVDSIKSIVSKFPEMQKEVQEFDKFKNMYKWAFKFGLDNDVGQRILPSDIAILLWKLVFEQRKPKILDRWLAFLECHPSVRGIPRDTWNMFLNFSETIGDDLSTYDDTEAWPSLFDDFVEYENDQLNQNISKDPKQ